MLRASPALLALVAATVLGAIACSGSRHPEPPSTPLPNPPAAAPAANPTAPDVAASTPDDEERRAAIARCAAGPDRATVLRAGSTALAAFLTCADLFREPACREAIRAMPDTPVEARISRMVGQCRDAYCPRFPEPRPAACADPMDTPSRVMELGSPLLQAALALDHGLDPAQLPRILPLGPIVVPVVPAPPAAPASPPVTVSIAPVRGGLRLVVDDPGQAPVELRASATPTPAELARLPATLAGRRVLVAADRALAYAVVVAVLDALRARGVTDFALAVAPPGP